MPKGNNGNTVDGTRGYYFDAEGQLSFAVSVWPLQNRWRVKITDLKTSCPLAIGPDDADNLELETEAAATQWAEQYMLEKYPAFVSLEFPPEWKPERYNQNGTLATN